MADGIKVETNIDEVLARFGGAKAYIIKATRAVVNTASIRLQRHIREDLFLPYPGGTTDSTLSTRSGILKKSVKTIPAVTDGINIKGGINIGTKYASVHFGKSGQVTTITSKSGKMLAIPLKAAMDSHGVARGGPRDTAIFGKTFIIQSKMGLIICGKLNYVKGKKAGQTKGNVLPLFALRRSVKVKARIHPEALQQYTMPIIGKGLAAIKAGLESSTLSSIPETESI